MVTAADGADDTARVELVSGGGGEPLSATMRIPRDRLAGSGLRYALANPTVAGLAGAAERYATTLSTAIAHALGTPFLPDGGPTVIAVSGEAGLHDYIWEALPIGADGPRPTVVLRLPAPDTRDEEPAMPAVLRQAELNWIGCRPHGPADIRRYRVAGNVLPTLFRADSALAPGRIRTDATAEDLDELLAPPTHDRPILIHLDAHGASQVRPGADGRVDPVLSFALRGRDGPVRVTDDELLDRVVVSGCQLFATNACFGAQQRGIAELPFPGQLVGRGVRAAVSAREPLEAWTATQFFGFFYDLLAGGESVVAAFSIARLATYTTWQQSRVGRGGVDEDERVRALLQPVLWVRELSDIDLKFVDRSPDAPALGDAARELLSVSMYDGLIGIVLDRLEDDSVHGLRLEVGPTIWCDADTAALVEMFAGMAEALGPHPVAGEEDVRRCLVGTLSDAERRALVRRRFSGTATELELLAAAAPGDHGLLSALAQASDGAAARALVMVLAWGDAAFEQPPAWLADHLERRRGDPPELAHDENAQRLFASLATLPYALPAWSDPGWTIVGGEFPPSGTPVDALDEELGDTKVCAIEEVDGHRIVRPAPHVALGARSLASPEYVFALRAELPLSETQGEVTEVPGWTFATRLSALSLLSLAVAARQVGYFDRAIAGRIGLAVGSVDRAAAVAVVEALLEGGRGWPPLEASMVDSGTQLIEALRGRGGADTAEDRAISALRQGRSREIPDLLEGEREDLTTARLRAYSLAIAGHPAEARTLLLPYVRRIAELSQWDQCELLHALGAIAEREGKFELAAWYMLDERALRHPGIDARFHNRIHLVEIMLRLPDGERNLVMTVAREAVALAPDPEAKRDAVRKWIEVALRLGLPVAPVVAALEEPEMDSSIAELRAVKLARALVLVEVEDPGAAAALEALTDGDDWEAALACLSLGATDSIPTARRIEALRRGAALPHPRESALCWAFLIGELWHAEDRDELTRAADALMPGFPGFARLIRAALAVVDDKRELAVEHLVDAMASTDAGTLGKQPLRDLAAAIPDDIWEEAIEGAVGQALRALLDRLEDGSSETETSEALDAFLRHYLGLDNPAADAAVEEAPGWFEANRLAAISERLWDLGHLGPAARARVVACQLYSVIGARDRLANELGWLATINRQRGHVAEAESQYQRAIAVGDGVLPDDAVGSMYGRYGNLLHDTGDYEAAVATKWRGLCTTCSAVPKDTLYSPDTLNEVLGWEPPDSASWCNQLANFANCLIDAGDPATALRVISVAYGLVPEELRGVGPGSSRYNATDAEMVIRVLGRLVAAGESAV